MTVSQTSQFKKDLKRQIKRGTDINKIINAINILLSGEVLPSIYKDHALTGNWKRCRDCHIEPDWVMIYRVIGDELRLERTGTHSDLF